MDKQLQSARHESKEKRLLFIPLYACLFYLLFQLSLSAAQSCPYSSLPRRLLQSITKLSPLANHIVESQRIFLDDLRIASFRDQTRDRLQTLKIALLRYKSDIGDFPRVGSKPSASAFSMAGEFLLGAVPRRNVLFRNPQNTIFPSLVRPTESAKWRGPYLEGDPEKILLDPNGIQIKYEATDRQLVLHSAGFDGEFDTVETCLARDYHGDDQTVIITSMTQ